MEEFDGTMDLGFILLGVITVLWQSKEVSHFFKDAY